MERIVLDPPPTEYEQKAWESQIRETISPIILLERLKKVKRIEFETAFR